MIGATLKSWHCRAMHVVIEGVGAFKRCTVDRGCGEVTDYKDGVEGCPAGITGSFWLSGIGMGFRMPRDGFHRVWRDLGSSGFGVCRKDV